MVTLDEVPVLELDNPFDPCVVEFWSSVIVVAAGGVGSCDVDLVDDEVVASVVG